jgi:glucan 1,3-beta-glucosidase
VLCLLFVSCQVRFPEETNPEPVDAVAEKTRPAIKGPGVQPQVPRIPRKVPKMTEKKTGFLRARGTDIVNADGQPVHLRGCNLGNWFLLEMWMLDMTEILDQHEFESILAERFGTEQKARLMELYRENWIRDRDFDIIRSFRFNVVRLPFHYSLLEKPEQPQVLREHAFEWLDKAVDMAARRGIYVILDMHGVPGGQSTDHTTGYAGQNRLWSEVDCQMRTAWLWKQIADHYRDSRVVAAYDIINEPFGDKHTDKHQQKLVDVADMVYREIRSVDTNHLVFLPATLQGYGFYGNPVDHGWENVGFTQHFYPGLFGEEPSKKRHAAFIARDIPWHAHRLKKLNVPFLVGEFNVVFWHVGGAPLMRRYYDLFAEHGWAATMWSYKLVKKQGGMQEDSWSMVQNADDRPEVSIKTSSLADIEHFFRWLGTMKYSIHNNLGAALTAKTAPSTGLMDLPELLLESPGEETLEGYKTADINGALPGGLKVHANGAVDIYGAGRDIYESEDQFRFVYREVVGDFNMSVSLAELQESHEYAKAGLMFRSSLDPDAAFVMVNMFPDGTVVISWRTRNGAEMKQKMVGNALFPARLRLRRRGQRVEAAFFTTANEWAPTRLALSRAFGDRGLLGMVTLSHDNRFLTKARFEEITFSQVGPLMR